MPHYVALIHKEADSCYGVSFPDWPGVVTAADTIDETMQRAVEVLSFAVEDWRNADGLAGFPRPRSVDELRADPDFRADAVDAVLAAVPLRLDAEATA